MSLKQVAVYDPTGIPAARAVMGIQKVNDLKGKTLGLLWNSKPNGEILLTRMKQLLYQEFQLAADIWQSKPTAGVPAKVSVLDELAGNAALVLTSTGD